MEELLFVCYPKCTTCARARKWLNENDIAFRERDIKTEHPKEEELRMWQTQSGLRPGKFFNTSGMLYRSMELAKKLPGMSEDEMFRLLASDGMLVKRPILVSTNTVLVGFKEDQWRETLLK